MTAETDSAASRATATGSGHFRPDIEGMRAVAVVLILLFHAGIPVVAGGYVGVDVFFVISGFLITGLLLREIERTGTVSRARFYARRIRRLLPAAAVVLSTVAVLTIVALPTLRWAGIATDIRWSALYAVNWRFAGQAVDYLAAEEAASPLQHFWSLAVEEQFYLVWPLLMLGSARLAIVRRLDLRRTLLISLAAIGIPSLLWSIYLTGAEPGRAFFVSTTRVWELALGGGIAILAPTIARIPQGLAALLAASGTLGVIATAVAFDSLTPFPGYQAALPVVSTALLIAAGTAAPNTMVSRFLGLRPMRFIGSMSYSLYLWHWPLLVVAIANWGPLSPWQGTGVVLFSVIPAFVSHRYVEQRWRYSEALVDPPRRGILVGAGLTLVGLVAATVLASAVPDRSVAATEESPPPVSATQAPATPPTTSSATTTATTSTTETPTTTTVPEPTVIGPIQPDTEFQLEAGTLRPDPLDARADLPVVYDEGCHQNQEDPAILACTYGATEPQRQVAIVGDSHAAMWIPPLRMIAEEQGWELKTITKSNCQLADIVIANGNQQRPYENCVEWNENVIEELTRTRPDLVLVAGRFWPILIIDDEFVEGPARETALAIGLETAWSQLTTAGLELIAIQDVPYPDFDVAECVLENLVNLAECAMDRTEVMAENTPHAVAANQLGVGVVDLTDQICFEELCPSVIDDILVWRDAHHLTATYARLLAEAMTDQLQRLAPIVFPRGLEG